MNISRSGRQSSARSSAGIMPRSRSSKFSGSTPVRRSNVVTRSLSGSSARIVESPASVDDVCAPISVWFAAC